MGSYKEYIQRGGNSGYKATGSASKVAPKSSYVIENKTSSDNNKVKTESQTTQTPSVEAPVQTNEPSQSLKRREEAEKNNIIGVSIFAQSESPTERLSGVSTIREKKESAPYESVKARTIFGKTSSVVQPQEEITTTRTVQNYMPLRKDQSSQVFTKVETVKSAPAYEETKGKTDIIGTLKGREKAYEYREFERAGSLQRTSARSSEEFKSGAREFGESFVKLKPDIGTKGVGFASITGDVILREKGFGEAQRKARNQTISAQPALLESEFVISTPSRVKEKDPTLIRDIAIAGAIVKSPRIANEAIVLFGKKKYVPAQELFETTPKGELADFSTTRSVKSSISSFKKGSIAEGKIETSHVSQSNIKEGKVLEGESADTGLYVSPKGRASAYFTGLSKRAEYEQSYFDLTFKNPTLNIIRIEGIERIPQSKLSKGFDVSNKFLVSQSGSGKAFITRRSELAFDKNLFTKKEMALQKQKLKEGKTSLSTVEAEAIIPEGTRIVKEKNKSIGGFTEYTRIEGEIIPIKKYSTEKTNQLRIKSNEDIKLREEILESERINREYSFSSKNSAPYYLTSVNVNAPVKSKLSAREGYSDKYSFDDVNSIKDNFKSENVSDELKLKESSYSEIVDENIRNSGYSSSQRKNPYSYSSYSPNSYGSSKQTPSENLIPRKIVPLVLPTPPINLQIDEGRKKGTNKKRKGKPVYRPSFAAAAFGGLFDKYITKKETIGKRKFFTGFELRGL